MRPATSSRPPATRASSTRSRPMARARASTRPTRPTSCRSLHDQDRRADRRHRVAGARVPHRRAGKAFVLLDSPFREIHALRVAADGTIYAAALSATPSSAVPIAPPSPSPEPSRAGHSVGVDGDHRRSRSWKARSPSSTAPSGGRSHSPSRPRRDLPHPSRWPLGHGLGDGRRCALRPARRGRRQPAGRHGHGGKIFRLSRRSRARHAARRAPPPVRSRRCSAIPRGRIVGATSNPGKVFALSSTRGAQRAPTSPTFVTRGTVATWGAIRWRASARAGQVADRHAHRAIRRRRTRPGARGRTPTRTPTANRSAARTRGICSGARR